MYTRGYVTLALLYLPITFPLIPAPRGWQISLLTWVHLGFPVVHHGPLTEPHMSSESSMNYRVETVLLHNVRQSTCDAVRQVYAVQPNMGKAADIELDT